MRRVLQMFCLPFALRAHVQDKGSIAVAQSGLEIADAQLRELPRFFERLSLEVAGNLIIPDAGQFQPGFPGVVRRSED